jgi:PAS domain S-box-containing protein
MRTSEPIGCAWIGPALNCVADGVVTTDREGLVRTVNHAAESLIGCHEVEVRGRPIVEVMRFFSERGGRKPFDPVSRVLKTGKSTSLREHTLSVGKSGGEIRISDRCAPIRDGSGLLIGAVLVLREQTKKRVAVDGHRDGDLRFQMLFERMSEGVALHDMVVDNQGQSVDYRILAANPAFEVQTGIRCSDVVGRLGSEVYGADAAPYLDVFSEVVRTGKTITFETDFVPLRKRFRISAYSTAPNQFATVFEDATERLHTQNALVSTERQYRSLFENMMEGFAFCEMSFEGEVPVDFVYLDVNEAFGRLTGLKDVVGRRVSDVIPGIRNTNPELFEIYGRVARTGRPESFETYLEGLGIWFSVSVYSPESGKFVAVFNNVTERRNAEDALKASEAKFRKLFEQATEGIALTEAGTGIVLDCNQALLGLSGFKRAEIVGKARDELFAPTDKVGRFLLGRQGKPLRGSQTSDAKLRLKSGRTTDVVVKESVMHIGDRAVVHCFVSDVTDERRTQKERQTTLDVLRLLNEGTDHLALMKAVTSYLHLWSGCEAVSVRLKEGDAFPYYLTSGFPQRFVRLESDLCSRDEHGQIACDESGKPILECMCGTILRGRIDPTKPFFSEKGSFWTNSTTDLLASTTDADRTSPTRNRCNREGYESVALVALKCGGEILGLLQMNDHAKGKFTPELIGFIEQLADQIGMALGQRLVSQALKESESRLRLAVNATNIGLFDWDLVAGSVRYSPEWKANLGHAEHEVGDTIEEWRSRIHPDDFKRATATVEKHLLEHGQAFYDEYRLRHKDGSYRWMLCQGAVQPRLDGRPAGLTCCFVDISRQKAVEDEVRKLNASLEERVLERTNALEAANGELEAFAYSISHDLRAPLRGIDGLACIMAEDYGQVLDEEGKAICARINTNTRRMGQLIDDLLCYSRLGRTEVKFSDIDMTALAQGVFQGLSEIPNRPGLEFNVGRLPPAIGDPSLIQQIWANLIGNAVKFTSKCENPKVEIGGYVGDGEHVYYVQDNGAGFDMAYAGKLFGVFQRLHAAGEFDGTGVGLAIVKRVAMRHGGRVWAEGRVGQGASFFFALPAADLTS